MTARRGFLMAMVVLCIIAGDPVLADDPPNQLSGTFGESAGSSVVVPSSGSMMYSVPFMLPQARGSSQPALGLSYTSGAGTGEAGLGWSLNLPSIERAPLSGWPKYLDDDKVVNQDRYAYNGRPLTFVCIVGGALPCPLTEAVGHMPAWATGYWHYRLELEGTFERFFLSSDRSRWIVQRRGGEILEFGKALTRADLTLSDASDVDARSGKIFRWNLVRQHDLHGDRNLTVYRWAGSPQERKYLQHIFYTPPAAGTASAPIDSFAYHVELTWETPPYRQSDFTYADRWRHYRRLRRVAVSSKTWQNGPSRELVRAYRLRYFGERSIPGTAAEAPMWNRSALQAVQMEGRCKTPVLEIGGRIPDPAGCTMLPATTFEYQPAQLAFGAATRSPMTGAAAGDGLTYVMSAAVMDVDRDGLPDVVQAWPQNVHYPGGDVTYSECGGKTATYVVRNDPDGGHDPKLVCNDPSAEKQTILRSARAQRVWVNGGRALSGALTLVHNCLDAGEGSPGTIAGYHTISGPVFARNAALFNLNSAEAIGDWGDASMLWSIAGYRGFRIEPTSAANGPIEDFSAFCPGEDSSHPALRWKQVDDVFTWAKTRDQGTSAKKYHQIVDVNGDGFADLIADANSPAENADFKQAAVWFTRRISKLDTVETFHGPALIPFATGEGSSDPITIVPKDQDYAAYADVNGDGILDLITARSTIAGGQPDVRLGDGRGGFGCNASDVACTLPGNGSWLGRAYKLFTPDAVKPWPLQAYVPYFRKGQTVSFFHDVTGDGLADLVSYEPMQNLSDPGEGSRGHVQLWVNVDGRTFRCANSTDCVVATISGIDQPYGNTAPYRVVFTDVDGNGTEDFVLLGTSAVWHFSFISVAPVPLTGPRAPRPGLLTRIRNGIGADTEVVYETIQELDQAARSANPLALDSFDRPWLTHSPQVVPVVTRVTTRDTSSVMGTPLVEPYRVTRNTRFRYRDPAYDPWQRSFRGFRKVRSIATSGEVEQTWFYFGACEDGGFVTQACRGGSEADDYVDKAVVGARVRVDRFVPGFGNGRPAKWLSTETFSYDPPVQLNPDIDRNNFILIRTAGPNADRPVRFAPVTVTDSYIYDTAMYVTSVDKVGHARDRQPAPEQVGRAHLRIDTRYDDAGNLTQIARLGRLDKGGSATIDPRIETDYLPTKDRCGALGGNPATAGDWTCLATATVVTEHQPPVPDFPASQRVLRHFEFGFNQAGDLTELASYLSYPVYPGSPAGLARDLVYGTGPTTTASTAAGRKTLATLVVDAFGNVTTVTGPASASDSCTRTSLDSAFAQFPATVTRYSGAACTGVALQTEFVFDRGLGGPSSKLLPGRAKTAVDYDAFGRVAAVFTPAPDLGPYATELATQITYLTQAPTPWIEIKHRVAKDDFVTSIEIFNGVGEHILGFDQADPIADGSPWVLRDWTERDHDGRVVATLRPWFFGGSPVVVANTAPALAISGARLETVRDPFGRPTFDRDGSLQTAEYTYLPLELRVRDAEQLKAVGPYAGLDWRMKLDGHGRTIETRVPAPGLGQWTTTRTEYLGTGEPIRIERSGGDPALTYVRTMRWDSFGRMIHNAEPNTSTASHAWDYVYDDESRLVGTSDARGCGKNLYYDALGRLTAEDFSPCLADQPAYTKPNLTTGDGTEAFYTYDRYEAGQILPTAGFADDPALALGRLVSVQDRGAHTRFNYDARGRTRRVTKQLARPGPTAQALTGRYAAHWFTQETQFDLGDRLRQKTTGLEQTDLTVAGASFETMNYSARGALREIAGTYGVLVSGLTYSASGRLLGAQYGDLAGTKTALDYDARDRLKGSRVFRVAAPALWTNPPPPGYSLPSSETTQLVLSDLAFTLDDAGNPLTIQDSSTALWPVGARAVSRTIQYDASYRIQQVDYQNSGDPQEPVFGPEALAGDRRPIAELRGAGRVTKQTFLNDWQGNVLRSDDNENLRFDRSLGGIKNGVLVAGKVLRPNQLLGADGINAIYDAAGNVAELTVARSTCWNRMPACTLRFRYDWDEVGQMVRARRWDFPAGGVPAFSASLTPIWDLAYMYGTGPRVVTSTTDVTGVTRHTLDVFDSLRINDAAFNATTSEYVVAPQNEVGFVGGVARVFYDRASRLPMAGPTRRHVYFNVSDHLGSSAFVIDKDSGELVERTTYQAFGALEADFRPRRWDQSREDYKFTGKKEDIEVGVTYFGSRFYNARLGRWMSADPMTIHGLRGDANPYAYVGGRVTTYVDAHGLVGAPPGAQISADGSWSIEMPAGSDTQYEFGGGPNDTPAARPSRDDSQFDRVAVGGGRYVTPTNIAKAAVNEQISALQTASNALQGPIGWTLAAVTGSGGLDRFKLSVSDDGRDVSEYVPPLVMLAGGAAATAMATRGAAVVATHGGVDIQPAAVFREIAHGEKLMSIANEINDLANVTKLEFAVVRTTTGSRVIVMGGEHGIDFTSFPIKTLIGHSHPPGIVNALSASDLAITRSLGQRSSWLLENGVLRRFWLSDYP